MKLLLVVFVALQASLAAAAADDLGSGDAKSEPGGQCAVATFEGANQVKITKLGTTVTGLIGEAKRTLADAMSIIEGVTGSAKSDGEGGPDTVAQQLEAADGNGALAESAKAKLKSLVSSWTQTQSQNKQRMEDLYQKRWKTKVACADRNNSIQVTLQQLESALNQESQKLTECLTQDFKIENEWQAKCKTECSGPLAERMGKRQAYLTAIQDFRKTVESDQGSARKAIEAMRAALDAANKSDAWTNKSFGTVDKSILGDANAAVKMADAAGTADQAATINALGGEGGAGPLKQAAQKIRLAGTDLSKLSDVANLVSQANTELDAMSGAINAATNGAPSCGGGASR